MLSSCLSWPMWSSQMKSSHSHDHGSFLKPMFSAVSPPCVGLPWPVHTHHAHTSHRQPSEPVTTPFPVLAGPPQISPSILKGHLHATCVPHPSLRFPTSMSLLTPAESPQYEGCFFYRCVSTSPTAEFTTAWFPVIRGAVFSSEAVVMLRHTPCIIELDSVK